MSARNGSGELRPPARGPWQRGRFVRAGGVLCACAPGADAVHTDVFTTHPEIMIANSHAENTIIRWAEPLSTIAWAFGFEAYPSTYLEKIWRLMFHSHAHDSMHGLGPRTLAEGEMARLGQAHIIAKGLARRGLQNITKEIDTAPVEDTAFFLAENVPALGYKTYKLKWTEKQEYPYPHEDWEAPRVLAENLLPGPNEAESEHIRLGINSNGTVDITDKASGHSYANLNYFLDCGDEGNMWMSSPPGNDSIISSLDKPAEVSVNANGPLAVGFTIRQTLVVPAEYDWTHQCRSKAQTEIPLTVKLTLRKGCPYVEVVTELENTARDHYLKVCFPTELKAETTCAEGSFAVAEYPVKPGFRFRNAYRLSLAEKRLEKLARAGANVTLKVGKGKIVTLEFTA